MKQIRIATRASKLALAQANETLIQLAAIAPEIPISIVEISTKGDRDNSDFLYKSGSVGVFTSEVERALLDGQADIAVHSLKDLPTTITKGLVVSAIPPRQLVSDVMISANDISSINDLPENAVVGTSSLRRITQLKLIRPDLDCRPLRGNIETRIRKAKDGKFDAIVIARAGLNRLGLSGEISLDLPPEEFIPAPGQGALAIQTRTDNSELCRLVARLDDKIARVTAQTERRILAGLHGGCSIPLGVYSHIENNTMHIHSILCNLDSTRKVQISVSCLPETSIQTADMLTSRILTEGGRDILEEINREKKS